MSGPRPSAAFTASPYVWRRRPTRVVRVGDVAVGGASPLRVQSMTTTDTLDVAATELHHDGGYRLDGEGVTYSGEDFAALLAGWADRYPIVSIEDGMSEDDWDGWRHLTELLGDRTQLVGDEIE